MSERKRMSFKCNLNATQEEENVNSAPNSSCRYCVILSEALCGGNSNTLLGFRSVHAPFSKMSPNNNGWHKGLRTHILVHIVGGEALGSLFIIIHMKNSFHVFVSFFLSTQTLDASHPGWKRSHVSFFAHCF